VQNNFSAYIIMNPAVGQSEANAEECYYKIYDELSLQCHIKETTELAHLYLMVINPYKDEYEKNLSFFESNRFIERVYQYVVKKYKDRLLFVIVTREVTAAMIHLNVMMLCNSPIKVHKGKINHEYGFYIQEHGNTVRDKVKTLQYILKEAKLRPYLKFLDYRAVCFYQDVYEWTSDCPDDCVSECCNIKVPRVNLFKRNNTSN